MADSSTFVQSVENPQHNVDLCIYSALAKSIEESRHNFFVLPSVFHFVDSNTWHLGEMVDLVTRTFLSINEGIQLAKLERPKLKNTTHASPHV